MKTFAWLALTAGATLTVAVLSVELVSPSVRAGGQPASVDTLSDLWWLGFLLFVPVYLVARRSVLLALPAVAIAVMPQFEVARIGIDRMVGDDGLESLLYLLPIGMTVLCLGSAIVGGVVRLVETRQKRVLTPTG